MPLTSPVATTLKEAVAAQFAYRPTFRHTLSKAVLEAVARRFPDKANVTVDHDSQEPYTLYRRNQQGKPRPERLLDLLLKAYLQGITIAFGEHDKLLLQGYDRSLLDAVFESTPGGTPPDEGAMLALNDLNDDLNAALAGLMSAFQQAQVRFWNEDDAIIPVTTGIGRHGWMRQVLRASLLGAAQSSELAEEEKACLYEVLLNAPDKPAVAAIELEYSVGAERFTHVLPDLLIEAERETRGLVIHCMPGRFAAFDSLGDFEAHLASQYAAAEDTSLSWRRLAFEGDACLQQSALLLEGLLDAVQRLRLSSITDIRTLEQALSTLTDPATRFLNDHYFPVDAERPALPQWLLQATDADQFEYQVALLDLAIGHALAGGRSSLEGVQDLHGYAARRLREELLKDYPTEANYFPDDLLLQVSIPDPLLDKELPVRLQPAGSLSLTEFAIGRLDGLDNAVITGISHRHEQLIMPWMTPIYAVELVERVDVGGVYPGHVAALLDEPQQQPARIARFSREWRSALLFDALRGKVEGTLDTPCWQALAEFCRSGRDLRANLSLAPLAFRAAPDSRQRHCAACMYVITLQQPSAVLLYRPLYREGTLLRYADNAALMAALSQAGALQDSVLEWLPPSAYSTYANGGFVEPHLRRVIFDTSLWPEPVEPVQLALSAYLADIDTRLYQDKRQALLAMAERQSLSNAEQRWRVAKRFAWMLFDLVAPVLPGPLGKVAWVVGLLAPLLQAGSGKQQEEANTLLGVNLAASLAMSVLHARLPRPVMPPSPRPASAVALAGEPLPRLPMMPAPAAAHGLADAPLPAQAKYLAIGHGWGAGPLAQQAALQPYQAHVDLSAAVYANRLYSLDERFYAELYGKYYEVAHDQGGRRILGPSGNWGPWLFDDGSRLRVRIDGFAWGGQSGRKGAAQVARDQRKFDQMAARVAQCFRAIDDNLPLLRERFDAEVARYQEMLDVQERRDTAALNKAGLDEEKLQKLLVLFSEKIDLKLQEYQRARAEYVNGLEADIAQLSIILDTVDQQLDLQRRRNVVVEQSVDDLLVTRTRARQGLTKSAWGAYFRLLATIDYPLLARMEANVAATGWPELKARMRKMLPIHARLIELSTLLDHSIPLIAEDTVVAMLGDQQQVMRDVKGQRESTTVNLLIIQAHFYKTLALQYELGLSERLQHYRMNLMGPNLMLAAFAHVEVQRGNLLGTARTEVLQSAWEEYSAALIDCIDIKRDGGELVDVSMLEALEQSLQALKRDAGMRLGSSVEPEVLPYTSSKQPREVAYLDNGQIVVGDRVEIDGRPRLEIRNLVTGKVTTHFEWVDGRWAPPKPPAPVGSGQQGEAAQAKAALVAKAVAVLAADKPVQATAEQYLAQHVSHRVLERLVDGHIAELQRLSDSLQDDAGFTARKVREQLAAWPERRRTLLVQLFAQTRFPDAQALRYLHEQKLLKIDYTGKRHPYRDGSFDDYEIRLLKKPGDSRGKLIWVAHFHYPRQDTPATQFTVGHLKTAQQRSYGPAEEVELAKLGQWVHRGPLLYSQVKDIIAFL
ncbi:DUF6543 domain-containing protein [Pseudomonas sp.]|uniref:DUF6543 domain-containing protein n=1 Tax=Pseudomonas sp. TaxID=306 RepID=UPI0028AE45B5|nr:DUF6543 domain-containing protein [Pseudomonas sp.]